MIDSLKYTLNRSKRKTISLSVDSQGNLIVRAPRLVPLFVINQFIASKSQWVSRVTNRLANQTQLQPIPLVDSTDKAIIKTEFKNDMLIFLSLKSKEMNLTFNQLKLSSARTRWGSCSSNKNINLNWRLALLPKELREYVAIHELAHLQHMNHSKLFWSLVQKHDSNYTVHNKELRKYSHFLSKL